MPNQSTAAVDSRVPMDHKKLLCSVMLQSGASYSEIIAKTGMSSHTILLVKKDMTGLWDQQLAAALRSKEIDRLTLGISQSLERAYDPKILKKASHAQLMVGIGIAVEKRELLAGRATSRVETKISDSALDQEISALQVRLDKMLAIDVDVVGAVVPDAVEAGAEDEPRKRAKVKEKKKKKEVVLRSHAAGRDLMDELHKAQASRSRSDVRALKDAGSKDGDQG